MNEKELRCDSCGLIKDDVVLCIDPYLAEIDNREVEVYFCEDCYQAHCDDV